MSTVVEKVIYLADAYRRHGIKVTVFFCLCPIKICDILIFFTCSVADPDQNPDSDVPDPHVFGPSGSGSISQRYGSGSGFGSFFHLAKIVIKILIPNAL
jgi:hypothetical protein